MTTTLTDPTGRLGVAGYNTDAYAPPGLILAGSYPLEVSEGTLLDQNADSPAFSLVGRITATGKLTLSAQAASDGSQIPVGVTTKTVLDNSADNLISFWRSGNFNYDYITKGAGWSLALLRIAVEASGAPLFFDSPATATPTDAV